MARPVGLPSDSDEEESGKLTVKLSICYRPATKGQTAQSRLDQDAYTREGIAREQEMRRWRPATSKSRSRWLPAWVRSRHIDAARDGGFFRNPVGEIPMKQRLLVSSIIMGLCATLAAGSVLAQDSSSDQQASADQAKKKKESQEFETVVVTGSLIPKAQIETASPVITITASDIKREGFRNVYDALRSLPLATGQVQDNQFTNSFTPGATTVSLLGLDPSFTLLLLNGKPMSDYPFLYNSNSNFVDLNTIPNFMVDHIDILPGNQSAIYGSAAIAGVVNIVLKQKMEGVDVDFRAGGYSDGGGSQQRFEIGGGGSWGKLDAMFALELNRQEPVFRYQRSYTDSYLDNPVASGRIAQRDRLALNIFNNKYVDPGKSTCDAISNLFNGGETYANRPGIGSYCGSFNGVGYGTLLNGNKTANAYGSLKYQLNDSTQLYGDLLIDTTKTTYLVGGTAFWQTFTGTPGFVYDVDDGGFYLLQHIFAPEEIGHEADGTVYENSYIVNVGARGTFGSSSNWNYDASFHRSEYNASSRARRLLTTKVNDFFLGPPDGTDPYGYGYPAYHIRSTPFWGAITPAQYDSISDFVRSNSQTYTQQANLTVTNTDLFALPAGSVGFAGLIEAGNQLWDNPVDPRITAGEFWGTGGTSGHGTRDRQAAAAEFNIPVFSQLTADASLRYDRYSAAGNSQGKVTYKLGLEYRPIDTLLFRGNYATAFRAPDMGYVFSTGSSFFTTVRDTYNCRRVQGDNYGSCNTPYDSVQINGFQDGNKALKYITAKSWGYGLVWSPNSDFSTKLDYYHVNISNEVNSYSLQTILDKEADCRLGHTQSGVPVDGNSGACQAFIAEVGRNPADALANPLALNTVTTVPINISNETVSGITANLQYRLEAGSYGDFTFNADYNTTLKHEYRQFPDDPVTDILRENSYYDPFKNIGAASVNWKIGSWSTTLRGVRYGKTWSHNGLFTVAPWMVYNATIQYNFGDDAAITLIGNNIFNSRPPVDSSFSTAPYYNVFNYNAYGRLVMLEFNMHFGGAKE
jgi:outer membrane receptor protein involved in Fe transport